MKHLAMALTVIGLATMLMANTASAQTDSGQYSYNDSTYYSGNYLEDYNTTQNYFDDYKYDDYNDYQMNQIDVSRFFSDLAKSGN